MDQKLEIVWHILKKIGYLMNILAVILLEYSLQIHLLLIIGHHFVLLMVLFIYYYGYMEGAIRSGERVTKEVFDSLSIKI